jgi:tRNA A37 threonylcarbamoyltransferase TsaD
MAHSMCDARGSRLSVPPKDLLVDNGAMIAWLGLLNLRAGASTPLSASQVRPYERTDDVAVTWI